MITDKYLFQMEPSSIINDFMRFPPAGFTVCLINVTGESVPAFITDYDLLLTADEPFRRPVKRIERFLPAKWRDAILRPRTLFVGSTVSEFALFPEGSVTAELPRILRHQMAEKQASLIIVKDLAPSAPFFAPEVNNIAAILGNTFVESGFILLEGQALGYVPVDFGSLDEYLSRFSGTRRADFRRKLRKRHTVKLHLIPTGDPMFRDPAVVDRFFRLYENVYDKSAIHFDKLTHSFFENMLNDGSSGGLLFAYALDDKWIGYFLCFRRDGYLVDKLMGREDPAFRENNLYFVSWFDILQYAIEHSYRNVIFGWTSPLSKAYLGAQFVFTKHAVYIAQPILRRFLARLTGLFESDRKILADWQLKHKQG